MWMLFTYESNLRVAIGDANSFTTLTDNSVRNSKTKTLRTWKIWRPNCSMYGFPKRVQISHRNDTCPSTYGSGSRSPKTGDAVGQGEQDPYTKDYHHATTKIYESPHSRETQWKRDGVSDIYRKEEVNLPCPVCSPYWHAIRFHSHS
jgi:hypothetical protein